MELSLSDTKAYVVIRECSAGKVGQVVFLKDAKALEYLNNNEIMLPGATKSPGSAGLPYNYETK